MTTITVPVQDIPGRLTELISSANSGASVVVTENDQPVARLVPIAPNQPRVPELQPGVFQVAADFDEPLPEEFWLGKE